MRQLLLTNQEPCTTRDRKRARAVADPARRGSCAHSNLRATGQRLERRQDGRLGDYRAGCARRARAGSRARRRGSAIQIARVFATRISSAEGLPKSGSLKPSAAGAVVPGHLERLHEIETRPDPPSPKLLDHALPGRPHDRIMVPFGLRDLIWGLVVKVAEHAQFTDIGLPGGLPETAELEVSLAFWYHSVITMCLLFWVEPVAAGCVVRKVKLTEWRGRTNENTSEPTDCGFICFSGFSGHLPRNAGSNVRWNQDSAGLRPPD